MIERQAIVTDIQGSLARVEVMRESSCGSCSMKSGCGTGMLGQLFLRDKITHEIENTINAEVGDKVLIGINESNLVKASFLIYLLPLVVLFVFAITGNIVAEHLSLGNVEFVSVVFGFFGLVIFFLYLKKKLPTHLPAMCELVMLRKIQS